MEESNEKWAEREKFMLDFVKKQKEKIVESEKEKAVLAERLERLEKERDDDRTI